MLKTLLYIDEPRPFYDFFVVSDIKFGSYRDKDASIITNADLDKLFEHSSRIILTGMGGMGKSMILRHLFLNAAKMYDKTKKLPILAFLREYEEDVDFFLFLHSFVLRFDESVASGEFEALLEAGRCQILLDGFDEISAKFSKKFEKSLLEFCRKYDKNGFVMTSRPVDSFIKFSPFLRGEIMLLRKEQAVELINKLSYMEDEKKLKEDFIHKLNKEFFDEYKDFAGNPLLLTLMLMNYKYFAIIPERKYLFYEKAYETLLIHHDRTKENYKREFLSVLDVSDFTRLLEEFSARSYCNEAYAFSKRTFREFFKDLDERAYLEESYGERRRILTHTNFLYDALGAVSIMRMEGESINYLHRSFQEYFAAEFFARADNETLVELSEWILFSNDPRSPRFQNFLSMLCDISYQKVERFIFLPYLKQIFDEEDERTQYWRFLSIAYDTFLYHGVTKDLSLYNITYVNPFITRSLKDKSMSLEISPLMRLLLDTQKLNKTFDDKFDGNNYLYKDIAIDEILAFVYEDENLIVVGDQFCLEEFLLNSPHRKSKPFEIIGYEFAFEFNKPHPKNHKDLINFFDNFPPLKNEFLSLKSYYLSLLQKTKKTSKRRFIKN